MTAPGARRAAALARPHPDLVVAPLAAALLVGCGGGGGPRPLDGTVPEADAGPDLGVADAGAPDAEAPDAGPPDCASLLRPTPPFDLAPGFRRTQIHPAAVFDRDRFWVTLTVAEVEGSGLDVVLVPVGCDGRSGTPIPVDDEVTPNDIDGALAVRGDVLLVAWQRDRGTGTIDTMVRAFSRDGAPLGESRALRTTREGEPVDGTHWFPQVLATDDGFVLVGTRGVDAARGFHTFVQRLDAAGAPLGEALEPAFEPGRSHGAPAAALDTAGALHLAWESTPEVGETTAWYASPGAAPAALAPDLIASGAPSLAALGPDVLVAFDAGGATARSVRLRLATAGGGLDAPVTVAERGFAPSLAEGAVLWGEELRGFSVARLQARAFARTPTGLALGPTAVIPTAGSVPLPYRPGIVRATGDLHLVLWSEGTSPTFTARGALVRLPAP
jgi:hypothetical protein